MSKKRPRQKIKKEGKDWPVVVYMWALGLGMVGYLAVGEMIFNTRPHPIHWILGLAGGTLGIGIGWLWYRWRGDII